MILEELMGFEENFWCTALGLRWLSEHRFHEVLTQGYYCVGFSPQFQMIVLACMQNDTMKHTRNDCEPTIAHGSCLPKTRFDVLGLFIVSSRMETTIIFSIFRCNRYLWAITLPQVLNLIRLFFDHSSLLTQEAFFRRDELEH